MRYQTQPDFSESWRGMPRMMYAVGVHEVTSRVIAPMGMAGLPDASRNLGEFRRRIADLEDGVTFVVRDEFVAGGRVGARDGYATLQAAIAELAGLTRESVPAAAVLMREGRYYGHVLKGRDLELGFRAPLKPIHLEEDTQSRVLDLRVRDRFDRLQAVVDGTYVHRFRS
jgi:hypothetical protein